MNSLEQLLAANPSTGSTSSPQAPLGVKNGKPFFMAHMIAGYPSMADSEKVADALVKGGANIIEMQIPFSDPMADGPTIAVASEEALKAGATVADSLELLKKISALGKPVAVMSYTNPVFRFGIPDFVKTITAAGASALIVPDCPFDSEEGQTLLAACKENNVCLIPVVSPGVPEERLKVLANDASGFWYCTSRQGITGANSNFASDLNEFIKLLRKMSDLPIAVGFGVKSKQDVQQLAPLADIVIAGSVFVSAVRSEGISGVEKVVQNLNS